MATSACSPSTAPTGRRSSRSRGSRRRTRSCALPGRRRDHLRPGPPVRRAVHSRGRCRSGCRSTSAPCAAPSRCSSPASLGRRSQRPRLQQGLVRLRRREREDRRRSQGRRNWRTSTSARGASYLRLPTRKARSAARAIVTFYLSAQPDEQFEAHGIDPARRRPSSRCSAPATSRRRTR